ncbi:MAG: phosphatidylglycerophosphatase A [Candidatus Omnitrophica bacterium]|nr:phosphatidylglycerophosphatase A [Candidatus Omnitrophota bacterium]
MKLLNVKDKIYFYIATVFGVGYTPLMPGSAGCVVAVFIYYFVRSNVGFFVITVVTIALAFLVSSRIEELSGEKDCKKIVVDDFAGQLLTFLFIPYSYKFLIIGFFLFRMLDMLKVYPANRIEKFPGAKGIVGDDLIAGIYANIILRLAIIFT